MKIVKIVLTASALLMMVGCASNTTRYPKYNYINKIDSEAKIVGNHKIEIVGPVTWGTEKACSVVDFVSTATSQQNSIHDVINIRADETKTSKAGGGFDYACKYWGLAVRYVPVEDSTPAAPAVKGKLTFTVNEAEVAPAAEPVTE